MKRYKLILSIVLTTMIVSTPGCAAGSDKEYMQDASLLAASGNVNAGPDSVPYLDIDEVGAGDTRKQIVNIENVQRYMDVATALHSDLKMKLAAATQAQADSMYLSNIYSFNRTKEFGKIYWEMLPALERWMTSNHTDIDKELFELIAVEGIQPVYIEDGEIDIEMDPFFYYEIFKYHLSKETCEYARLSAINNSIISADAGLIVPLDTLYQRAVRWEKFLDKYPTSHYRDVALLGYGEYMDLLLFCTYDNTPTFDRWTNEIDDYNLTIIRKLSIECEGTESCKILNNYLEAIAENEYKYSEEIKKNIMSRGYLAEWDPHELRKKVSKLYRP